ncbi:MAG: hypothetical protein ETSY1_16630 [Candidatus Entotheonella factor]|uniref:Uncharacterized protein n=1 Tax=Entotheonella factor TaxID=1429438 RepID=W4LNN3_ENTF1|nr:MAG: hypothetical protein ETSY1_16630 [Candidatus Entotheonella factor]
MQRISGPQRVMFSRRLGHDWRDLATYLEIPDYEQGFAEGAEGQDILTWLEQRGRLHEVLAALNDIGRSELAEILQVQSPPSPGPDAVTPSWPGRPYPGLCAFSSEEAPIFCGRDRHADALVERLKDPQHRFVAVVGASGSGKSSVVAAGVLPRLQQGAIPGCANWIVLEFTPGGPANDPFHALSIHLEPWLRHQRLRARDIDQKLRVSGGLSELVQQALGHREHAELVLFIDQFEELFTLCDESCRQPFINMLFQAASISRLRIIITLRSDFSAQCIQDDKLASLLNAGFYALPPPGIAELYAMITRPAALAGLRFEPDDLPWRILDDTGTEPGALALMAFALAELYEALTPEGVLTLDAYERFGGVSGVLGKRADETYDALPAASQDALGTVFKELVEVDAERGVPTRKRSALQHFGPNRAALDLIKVLTEARLLVCSSPEHGEPMVEVAHEALLLHWGLLSDWIEERFDDFRLLRQVKLAAAEWERYQRSSYYLWRHELLVPVAKMLNRLQPVLSPVERAFVRLESERLLEQIDDRNTSHQERVKIGDRLADIGDPRPGVELNEDQLPDLVWCEVPGGEVALEDNAGTFDVAPGYISKYPVTWAQYRCFLQAGDGYANAGWWEGLAEREEEPGEQYRELDNHPAEMVSWYDAVAYCRWLSAKLGYEIRLPTEWEWQQAATVGDPSRKYPWGTNWEAERANTYESRLGRTTAVGMYPRGASLVGALDMSGNILEWCLNLHADPSDTDLSSSSGRVVRGGSWDDDPLFARVFPLPLLPSVPLR